ncbi:hypothetical protein HYW18_03440 [Candidatus Uhrbacteria bacterium]|nr:hypothetical protein [Candidatus Uhrbacteria bacterium]
MRFLERLFARKEQPKSKPEDEPIFEEVEEPKAEDEGLVFEEVDDEVAKLRKERDALQAEVRQARIAVRNPTLHGMDTKERATEVLRFKEMKLAEKEYALTKAVSPLRERRVGEEVPVWDKAAGSWNLKDWKVLRFDAPRRTYVLYNQAAVDRGESLKQRDVHAADASTWETPDGRNAYAKWQEAERGWDTFGGEREEIARREALKLAEELIPGPHGADSAALIDHVRAKRDFENRRPA